jgi:hypothetical protein
MAHDILGLLCTVRGFQDWISGLTFDEAEMLDRILEAYLRREITFPSEQADATAAGTGGASPPAGTGSR